MKLVKLKAISLEIQENLPWGLQLCYSVSIFVALMQAPVAGQDPVLKLQHPPQ